MAYWKFKKESKKKMRDTANRLIGFDKSVNPHWKTNWKYYIKREYPWAGLIELIQYKLTEEYEYIKGYAQLDKTYKEQDLKQIQEVLDLGWKLLEFDYEKEWYDWYKQNSVPVTYVYKKAGQKPLFKNGSGLIDIQGELLVKLYDADIFDETLGEKWEETWPEDDASKKERKDWLKAPKVCKLSLWLEEYNKTATEMNLNLDADHQLPILTREDITTAYSSEYINGKTNEENYKHSQELLKKGQKQYQKDKKKYFNLIAKHYDEWGD